MLIRLEFSEELEVSLGRISLVGPDGKRVVLKVEGDPHDVNALIAPVHSPLAPGGYRVMWRVVSADGHPVDGSFVFTVGDTGAPTTAGAPTTVAPTMTPMPMDSTFSEHETVNWGPSVAGAPIIPALLRGLGVSTLMGAAGLLFFLTLSGAATATASVRATRLARMLTLGFAVLLPLHALAWAMNASAEHMMGTEMLASTMTSGVGRLELWRTGLALVAAWAFGLARRPRIALAFAFLALLASGATGHSSAIEPFATTPAKALHLIAGAVWLGGLLWLLTVDRANIDRFEKEAMRVSSLALVAVIVVAFTGVVQWRYFLPTLRGLFDSAYGVVLAAKIAGLLALVVFGAHHKFRVLPRLRQDPDVASRFGRTLRSEVTVMLVVLLLGGLIGYLPPPDEMHSHMQNMNMNGSTPHTPDQ